jgi:hypothetical protein
MIRDGVKPAGGPHRFAFEHFPVINSKVRNWRKYGFVFGCLRERHSPSLETVFLFFIKIDLLS